MAVPSLEARRKPKTPPSRPHFRQAPRRSPLRLRACEVTWAGAFLDYWCFRAMRSRLEPMKKAARTRAAHEELILNWFRAKGEISSGPAEGLNNKSEWFEEAKN